jgi:hypothetical protein
MSNNKGDAEKIQGEILRFGESVSEGLKKPRRKFISQMIFGIQAMRDIKLSNVSRSLEEEIKLIKVEQRLSRQIGKEDLTKQINERIIAKGAKKIKADTVLALDLTDVQKPFAKKMDCLAKVWDGSEKEVGQGYWIVEVMGANVEEEELIPMYSELYSQRAKGFESENEQIFEAMRSVKQKVGSNGIWAIDRGGDRKEIVEEMREMGLRFVIRARGDRKVQTKTGTRVSLRELSWRVRCDTRYKIKIDKEGYREEKEIRLGVREDIMIEGVMTRLVVIKGFGKEAMLLMTNVEKSGKEILDIYLTRWKCEESFRFLKHEYHLEDVRVRSYVRLRNTIVLMHAVFYFVSVYLYRGLRVKILLEKILEKAKRFFEVPVFKHYAIADGIYRLLFNRKWQPDISGETAKDKRQLWFRFT